MSARKGAAKKLPSRSRKGGVQKPARKAVAKTKTAKSKQAAATSATRGAVTKPSPKVSAAKKAPTTGHKPATKKSAATSETRSPKPTTASTSSAERYTEPGLRESLKAKIKAGSRGGKPGQWSARKAQLVAVEYRRLGGGYRGGPRTASQRRIQKWDGP